MAAKKKRSGRPTDYKPEYCAQIIAFLQDGKCIREFAAELGVSYKSLYNWMDAHPEFLHAAEVGKDKSYRWWIDQGRNGLYDTSTVETSPDGTVTKSFAKINARIYELFMHNIFDWSKKQTAEVESKTTHTVSIEDSNALIDKVSAAFKAKAQFDKA